MKDFRIITYIMSLKERDRMFAVLLIGISVVWGQGVWDAHVYKRDINDLQTQYRTELVKRSDSCSDQKERILMNGISTIRQLQGTTDSLSRINTVVVHNNNQRIKIVKRRK